MERELVEQAQRGDQEAFAALVHLAADRLYGIAYRILRDPTQAEDALQNALIDLWDDLPGLRDPDRFEAWAYRLIARASYREARRGRPWRRWPGRPGVTDLSGPVHPGPTDPVVAVPGPWP